MACSEGPTLVADSVAGNVTRLLISGLTPDTTRRSVEFYITSRGLNVSSVSELTEDGKCFVDVTNQLKDMNKFYSKTHKIKQAVVRIEQIEKEEEPPDTIEVQYPVDDIDKDAICSYFSGPMSGGDNDEKLIEWATITEPGLCHIKFESPEDAGDILTKKNHNFMNITFTVRQVRSSSAAQAMKVDSNFVPKEKPVKVEVPIVKTESQQNSNVRSSGDSDPASNIKLGTPSGMNRNHRSSTTHDETPGTRSAIKDSTSEEDGYERNKLVIKSIPQGVNDMVLGVFLAGQLDLDEGDFRIELEKDHALLILNREYKLEELKVFCKQITKKKVQGQVLAVELCPIKSASVLPDDGYERNKLVIGNIPQGVNDMVLSVFLASQLAMDEEEFSIELKKDHAFLVLNKEYKFEELEKFSKQICNKKVQGQVLTAELCHTTVLSDEDEYERNKLAIRNIPQDVNDAVLSVFLAGQLALDEEDFSIELKKDHALLIMKKDYKLKELENFCKLITSKKIKGQLLAAELYRTISEDDGYEKNKLVIGNIPQGANEILLGVFLAGQLAMDEEEFSIEVKKDHAFLVLKNECKLKELEIFCKQISSKTVKGQLLTAELCRVNCTILITEITNQDFASQDGLQMYFRTKKSGGGQDVVADVVMLGRKKAKVTFNKPAVVESVLSNKHSTLGPDVKMIACSPLDTLPEEEIDEPNVPDAPPNIVPSPKPDKKMKRDPVTITLDPHIAKYLSNNSDVLEGIGREVNASVKVVDRNKGTIELLSNNASTDDSVDATVSKFQSFVSHTVSKADIQVPPQVANEVHKMLVQSCSNNNMPLNINRENVFTVAGKPDMVEDLQKKIHDYCERFVQASDQIYLSPEVCTFFSKYASSQAKKAHPNVKMEINNQTGVLLMSGSRHDVACFKESFASLTAHAKVPVVLTKLIIQFLRDGKGAGILQTLINSNSVVPFFDPTQDAFLFLLCPHSEVQYAESVAMTITTSIIEKDFSFPQYFFTNVVNSSRFDSFKKKTSKQYAFHCAVEGKDAFKLVCRQDILDKLSKPFSAFVSEECSLTEKIYVKKGVWKLFHSGMESKWKSLEGEMKERGINLIRLSQPTALKPFVKIKGERECVAQMKAKLIQLQNSVSEKRVTVARPGVVQHFYKDPNGQVLLKGIENEAKVCIELDIQKNDDSIETDAATNTGKGSTFKKVCSANTRGVTVNLYTGDITLFNKAEVIVNAANESLSHGAGVAGAIKARGGPVIQQDSDSYVAKRGRVNTGSAVIFPRVGNLPPPYQAIVHAVGPMWSSFDKEKSIALLRKTIKSTLNMSKDYNSIAIPAISSGVFGFPIDIAASSAVKGVTEFLTNGANSNLNEINFVIFDDNVPAFKKAIKDNIENVHVFDEATPVTPTSASKPPASDSSQRSGRSRRRAPSKMNILTDTSGSTSTTGSTNTTPSSINTTPSNISSPSSTTTPSNTSTSNYPSLIGKGGSKDSLKQYIKITKDDILKHQCEVLVNTTDQQLGFGGYVGRVLLKAAGSGLQDECQKIPKPIPYGDIVTTKAYQLDSKHMIHVVLPGYSGTQSEEALRGIVKKCLQECTRLKAKSISIPSIGAGNLGYPSDVVASCLLEEAFRYLCDNDGHTSLQQIHFVIFDGNVHQSFQQCYSQLSVARFTDTVTIKDTTDHDTTPYTTSTDVYRSRSTPTTGAKPKPGVTGHAGVSSKKKRSSHEATSSGDRSMKPPAADNSCSFSLPNGILLHLVQGDITIERTDVIVNTTNPELQLVGSGVSGALLKKGGPALQAACDKARASNMKAAEGKVVETRCEGMGQLKCKSIFHIVFEGKDQKKLVKTILACLDRAEKMAYSSISLPAIGTGTIAYPPASAAEGIVKALKQFTQRKPTHIKHIRMIIFMPDMFKQFTAAFKKIEDERDSILSYIYDKGSKLLKAGSAAVSAFFNQSDDELSGSDKELICSDNEDSHIDSNEEDEEDFEMLEAPVGDNILSNISFDSEVTMCIYGESDNTVQRAEKRLLSIIDTLFINEEIDDNSISELPPTALKQLKEFAHEHSVDIDIENDPAIHSIKLHGCHKDVLLVKDKIRDVLTEAKSFKEKEKVAKTISKHVKWMWQLSDNPVDYDEVFNFEIEEAYQQNKNGTYQYKGENEKFTIDFSLMEETDLDTNEKARVIRVDFAEVEKPPNWVPMPKDSSNREVTVHLEPLKPSDPEYKDSLAKFDATMKSRYSKIVSMQRIQNPVLYGQYVAREKEMKKRNPPQTQNERWLFHGTKPAVVGNICTQGFNRSFKSVTAYGQGVYFARDASYSLGYSPSDATNQRYMFLTRVLTGEFIVGVSSMLVPPEKPGQKNVLYDATVNNTSNPSIFVVYTDAQAYASYLITFQ